MPKSENQKQKILFVMDYLEKHSHKDHLVNATELIRMLKQQGISADRKSIYSDVQALIDYGLDIVSVPGKNGGYYIASPKDFQMSELKLLIDAVLSSRYLTEKKSKELIEKLCRQCNEHDAGLMRRNVLVSGRVKSMNETIANIIEDCKKDSDLLKSINEGKESIVVHLTFSEKLKKDIHVVDFV